MAVDIASHHCVTYFQQRRRQEYDRMSLAAFTLPRSATFWIKAPEAAILPVGMFIRILEAPKTILDGFRFKLLL